MTRAAQLLEERSLLLLDLTHDAVFVRDMDGRVSYWNRGAEDLFGWTAEEAVGQVAHELLQTAWPEPFAEIAARLLRTGRWQGELVHTRRDGTHITVATRWALQRDTSGNPVAHFVTANDVTERKQAAEALRKSEEQWRAVCASLQTATSFIPGMRCRSARTIVFASGIVRRAALGTLVSQRDETDDQIEIAVAVTTGGIPAVSCDARLRRPRARRELSAVAWCEMTRTEALALAATVAP